MKRINTRKALWVATATAFLVGGLALWAQENAAPQGSRPSDRGGQRGPGESRRGGGFDLEAMQQRLVEGIHQRLSATDEDWKVIEPLVKDVMQKQSEARISDFGGLGRMMFERKGGPGGQDQGQRSGAESQKGRTEGERGGGSRVQNPEVEALSQVLESTTATPDEIKAKLEALRQARAKREEDLQKAREALRDVVTVKQEAMLVLMGLLD